MCRHTLIAAITISSSVPIIDAPISPAVRLHRRFLPRRTVVRPSRRRGSRGTHVFPLPPVAPQRFIDPADTRARGTPESAVAVSEKVQETRRKFVRKFSERVSGRAPTRWRGSILWFVSRLPGVQTGKPGPTRLRRKTLKYRGIRAH